MVKAVASSASSAYIPTLDGLPPAAPTKTNHVAPSALSGHNVKAGTSPDPRAGGICQRLGNLVKSIARSFRAVPATIRRLVNPQGPEAAAHTLKKRLVETYRLIQADKDRDSILRSLEDLPMLSYSVEHAGGQTPDVSKDLGESLEAVKDDDLKQAAAVLRGPAVSERLNESHSRFLYEETKLLLMKIKAAINDALTERLHQSVVGLADAQLRIPQRREAAADILKEGLFQIYRLIEGNARPDSILKALLSTSSALQLAGGQGQLREALQDALKDLRENLRAADKEALKRAVAVLGGHVVSDVQGRLDAQPEVEKLLMEIEATINDELADRLQGRVLELVRSARDLGSKGESTQRIADEFHQALDRAAELANGSGLYLEGDSLVLNGLAALPSDDRKQLLQHLSSEDLARLDTLLPDVASEKAQAALAHIRNPHDIDTARLVETAGMVIEARAARLSERFQACQQQLCTPPGEAAPPVGHAFLNGVAAAAAALEELVTHCKLHRVPMPLAAASLASLQLQVQSAVTAALDSGSLDPSKLNGAQLLRLSRGLHTLGIHAGSGPKLQAAEQSHLEHCRAVFQEKLGALVQRLANSSEPAPMLHALSGLEDASRALQSASLAFNPGTEASAESSSITGALLDGTSMPRPQDGPSSATQAPGSESDLLASVIRRQDRKTRASLARAFSEPQTQALISSLQVGAHLARHRRETLMANRFDNMARLYKEVASECAAGQAGSSLPNSKANPAPASDTPLDHQKFAAAHLTEATRTALRDAYALSMPANGNPSLQAGRFDPVQTQMMARAFESPLSDMGEQDRVIMGRYEMSEEFFEDVQEHFFLYVDDASQNQGPAELAAPTMRSPSREATADVSPGGRPLIDWNGPDLSESRIQQLGIPPQAAEGLGVDPQTLARIADGYSRLVQFCGGDEAQARTLTYHLNQNVPEALFETFATANPLSLPSGVRGYVADTAWSAPDGTKAADHKTRMTLSIGESGRPQLDVDDRIEGRAAFIGVDGKTTYLSADSYVHSHFRAELTENGSLRLLEAPSYGFNLEPSDFPATPRAEQSPEASGEAIPKSLADVETYVAKILAKALILISANDAPGEIGLRIQDALHAAKFGLERLGEQGVAPPPANGLETEASLLVVSSLDRLKAGERQPLLQAMRSTDLKRLMDADPTGAVRRHSPALKGAMGELEQRDAKLSDAFRSKAETLFEQHPAGGETPTDIEGLMRELQAVSDAYAALVDYHDGTGGRLTPAMTELKSRIGGHLRGWVNSRAGNLGTLESKQLMHLTGMLRQFNASPPQEVLRKAVTGRQSDLETAYAAAASETLRGFQNGDPHVILAGIRDMEAGFSPLFEIRAGILHDLGDSPDDGAKLRRSLLANVLHGLDENQVMAAFTAATSPDSQALLAGLYEASDTVIARGEGEDIQYGAQLNRLAAYFEEVHIQIGNELDDRGRGSGGTPMIPRDDTGEPILPSRGERVSTDSLPPRARAAFREVLRLDSNSEGAPEFRPL